MFGLFGLKQQSNTVLTELVASGKVLTQGGLEAIATMMSKNSAVRRFAVGDSTLGDEGLATLVPGFVAHKGGLSWLDLAYKGLTAASAEHLLEVVKGSASLEELLLARNEGLGDAFIEIFSAGLVADGTATAAVAAAAAASGAVVGAAVPATVGLLDLGQCSMTAAACPHLEAVLCNVTSIVLSANALGEEAGEAIGSALASGNSTLASIELNDCKLGDAGAVALAKGLATNTTLTKLFLGNNGITAAGARAIAAVLASNRTLQRLGLRDNEDVEDEGAVALATAFLATAESAATSGIVALDLAKCGLTAESLTVLMKVPTLEELVLFGNDLFIGFSEIMDDQDVFKAAASLVDLDLAACSIPDDDALGLMKRLMDHSELPALKLLGLGGNTVTDKDAWEEETLNLQEERGGLRVVWM